MDGNGETTIVYLKIWNHHPIETSIYKWLALGFQAFVCFPSSLHTACYSARPICILSNRFVIHGPSMMMMAVRSESLNRSFFLVEQWSKLWVEGSLVRFINIRFICVIFFSNRIFIVVYSLLESLYMKQLGSSSPPVQTIGQVFLFTAHLLDFCFCLGALFWGGFSDKFQSLNRFSGVVLLQKRGCLMIFVG